LRGAVIHGFLEELQHLPDRELAQHRFGQRVGQRVVVGIHVH
jgi:hypothetical protein